MTAGDRLAPLRDFVANLARLVGRSADEEDLLDEGERLLGELVAADGWLPEEFAVVDPARYRQYLLYCDGKARFSVVSFVWGPGQSTPVHDHTVWGLVGILRGAEIVQDFMLDGNVGLRPRSAPRRLDAGQVERLSPSRGDIHRVANAFDDRTSVSIHVYGADIGAVERSSFDFTGQPKRFVSGYANSQPAIWG